jgi:hypothetical protein
MVDFYTRGWDSCVAYAGYSQRKRPFSQEYMKRKILSAIIGLAVSSSIQSANADTFEDHVKSNGISNIATVFLTRNGEDSTTRKGSFHLPIGNKKNSSSSSSSSLMSGGNWVTAPPLISAWAFYSKDYPNGWTPAAYHQKLDFPQSTIPVITEDQYTQNRKYDTLTGMYSNDGNPVRDTRTYDAPVESRTVFVTSGSPYASSYTNCTSWTPLASSVANGQNFIQTRNCDFTWHQDYSFSIGGGWTDNWPGNGNQTQNSVGSNGQSSSSVASSATSSASSSIASSAASSVASSVASSAASSSAPQDWVTADSISTGWTQTAVTYTPWTPAINKQESDFGQARVKTTTEESYTQAREYSASTNSHRDVGSPTVTTRSTNTNESRDIMVYIGYTDVGPHVNCGTWTPGANTIPSGDNFTQTRNCESTERKNISYVVMYTMEGVGSYSETYSSHVTFMGVQPVYATESLPAVGTWNWWCWSCH